MFGEDCNGRKISLLNLNCGPSAMAPRTTTTTPRPPLNRKAHCHSTATAIPSPLRFKPADKTCQHRFRLSRSPEWTSSSTPPLVRHNSSSSRSESTTTSPMTPEYSSDPLDLQNKSTPYFAHANAARHNAQLYPNMQPAQNPFATSYHSHPSDVEDPAVMSNGVGALNQQALLNLPPPLSYPIPEPSMTAASPIGPSATYHQPISPISTAAKIPPTKVKSNSQSVSTQTNSSSSPSAPSGLPKKKFPCPHATRFSCSDTFTTSGHAARHGKKHTGEKSVVCPTCNKAFTRKDNMKQHERTHKNTASRKPGDSATLSTSSSSHAHPSRPGREGRSRSPSAVDSSPSAETESSGFDFAIAPQMHRAAREGACQSSSRTARANGRVSTGSRRSEEDGEGESPGLDALAAAAGMG
ncbi:MAG: hypothetical protein LQ349_005385 [Xanthoria aureola]|nr:MAG: hypothetical protein LQ349_005385 [Xanthoria aureola]